MVYVALDLGSMLCLDLTDVRRSESCFAIYRAPNGDEREIYHAKGGQIGDTFDLFDDQDQSVTYTCVALKPGSLAKSLPSIRVPVCEHVAHSLARCQGATPEAREAERVQYGYPRINDKGQPVFHNRREIREYESRSGMTKTYDRH